MVKFIKGFSFKNNEIKKAIECIWIKIAKEDIYEKNIIIFNNFRYVNISGHCFSRNNYCIKD